VSPRACLTAGGWPGSERHGRRSEAQRDTTSRRAGPEPVVGREASRSDVSPASKARRAKPWGVFLFGSKAMTWLGQARKGPRAPGRAVAIDHSAQPACEMIRPRISEMIGQTGAGPSTAPPRPAGNVPSLRGCVLLVYGHGHDQELPAQGRAAFFPDRFEGRHSGGARRAAGTSVVSAQPGHRSG